MNLPYSSRKLVREAEKDACRVIQATQLLGEVEWSSPPFGEDGDPWYEACFGCSEVELIDQAEAAADRFRTTRWWQRQRRQEALASYIRARARITVSHGLQTTWR
jgi:hypothetical protein